jgi:filamentous hemagglutinin
MGQFCISDNTLQGNEYFQGAGQHLPGGAPEMVIESIPTVDSAKVKTITTVIVK